MKVLLHFIIMGHYNKAARFDYQFTPNNYEVYDYKEIDIPVYVFYGSNDKLGNEKVSI